MNLHVMLFGIFLPINLWSEYFQHFCSLQLIALGTLHDIV